MHLNGEGNGQMDSAFKTLKIFGTQGLFGPNLRAIYMYINIIFKDHFSKTPWSIKIKFYRKHLYEMEPIYK